MQVTGTDRRMKIIYFRIATEEDLKMISESSPQVLREATAGYTSMREDGSPLASPSLLSSEGYYLVAVADDIVRGWVGIDRIHDFLLNDPVAFVTELYVLPAYRRKGIASLISKELMEHLKSEGHKRIQFNVFRGNPSRKIAESLGFKEVSTLMEIRLED